MSTVPAMPVMRKPKRIVQKAFDGTAAINAFVLQSAVGEGIAKMIETATFLLNEGICPSDLHRMTGMPLCNLRALGRGNWDGVRVGRTPVNLGSLLLNPQRHLRASVFLGYVEKITRSCNEDMVSGETFAAALRATQATCGHYAANETPARYLVLAVLEMAQGNCSLTTCPCCRVRYLTSRVTLRVQSGMYSNGECPNCKYNKSRKQAAKPNSAPGMSVDASATTSIGGSELEAETLELA